MNKTALSFLFLAFTTLPLLLSSSDWNSFKQKTLDDMSPIPGWCAAEKADIIMELIKENQCNLCVDLGVFSGKSLFPIAKTLQFLNNGTVYGVDAWDAQAATEGFDPSSSHFDWWNRLNYDALYHRTLNLISKKRLDKYCVIMRMPTSSAVNQFRDGTIDLIHFDANHNEDNAYHDVVSYLPKVKDEGYIILNDANWFSMKRALVYLLERAEIISDFSRSATYMVFRKSLQKETLANNLMDMNED